MSAADGGPAFPHDSIRQNPGGFAEAHEGMSLRDWFAGLAMLGLRAAANFNYLDENLRNIPARSYELADAMLAAREQKGEAE